MDDKLDSDLYRGTGPKAGVITLSDCQIVDGKLTNTACARANAPQMLYSWQMGSEHGAAGLMEVDTLSMMSCMLGWWANVFGHMQPAIRVG